MSLAGIELVGFRESTYYVNTKFCRSFEVDWPIVNGDCQLGWSIGIVNGDGQLG
jgi:hypothetical protein